MNTSSSNFLYENEQKWEPAGEGITRQILGYDGQIMMVKVAFEAGAIGYEHQHFHSQCSYVVSGVFEVTIKGEKQTLKAGDGFYVQPDLIHGAKCIKSGMLIDVFSPSRQDFLK